MRCRYVEISVIIHATESLDRILEALRNFFGPLPIVVEVYEGHHGNPIYLATSYVEDCDGLLDKLCAAFSGEVPASRGEGEGLYYLRLDKQALARGQVRAVDHDDVVRLKIRTRGGLCTG
ncbi:exosome protein [Pyrobaculum sp. 3827-6]|uniref:RNA-binding domain-containing protein n=1 Tax=Pyrobaculum sp. 3827-6 TaxID=2983604 RepID=UPI0021D919A4|nr:RNA-binding domain-containing protein [Pyrobaculum sp. 3827-6]MCU7788804.1 exosome protein [Pyrobaculum sp. 3827-6]